MPISRREFLRFSGLGSIASLLPPLVDPHRLRAAQSPEAEESYGVHFVDVAPAAGLTETIYYGDTEQSGSGRTEPRSGRGWMSVPVRGGKRKKCKVNPAITR